MKSIALGLAVLGVATPAHAQVTARQTPLAPAQDPHAGHQMPAPSEQAPSAPTASDRPAGREGGAPQAPQTTDPHAGHQAPMQTPSAEQPTLQGPHAGHQVRVQPQTAKPPPSPPADHAADRYFDPKRMAQARHHIRAEHGGARTGTTAFNLAEYQFRDDDNDGYRWDGEAWFGGDVNRLVLKTEGEGTTDADVDDAEVQALWARAISPYFNVETGVRYDFEPTSRTYGVLGLEGVAPYWFDLEAAAFLSEDGDVLGRFKASQDFRITQRLLLQPRVELNLAAQDVPESELGSGISNVEAGVRLRYEIRREFAPYVGVSWESKVGDTADFARDAGEDVSATSLVVGVRAWF